VGTRYDAAVVAAFAEACQEGQIRPGSVRLKKQPTEAKIPDIPAELEPETAAVN
jgi:hypothetical protein